MLELNGGNAPCLDMAVDSRFNEWWVEGRPYVSCTRRRDRFRVHYAVSNADRGRSAHGLPLVKGYAVVIGPVLESRLLPEMGEAKILLQEHGTAKYYRFKKLWIS